MNYVILSIEKLNERYSVLILEIITRDGKGIWYHKGLPRKYSYKLPTGHVQLLRKTYNAIQSTQGVCRRSNGYGKLLQFIKKNNIIN